MYWLLLITWGFLQLVATEKTYDHTVARIKNVELDIKALAASLSEVHLPTFSHAHELLAALKAGDAQFQVKESDKDATHLEDLQNFDAMESKAIYDTETNYTIHRNAAFINLDAPATTILTISDSHVEHCHPSLTSERLLKIAESSAENVGTYILGTSKGAWFKHVHLQEWVKPKTTSLEHAKNLKDSKGLLVLRRVVRVLPGETRESCATLETAPATHFELFESIRVRSEGTRPFSTTYGKESDMNERLSQDVEKRQQADSEQALARRLAWNTVDTNYGLIACKNGMGLGKSGWTFRSDDTVNPTYYLGLTIGCIQYAKTLASFNFNYDSSAQKALTDPLTMTGLTGVSCDNCYAYLGAGFLLYIEYNNWDNRTPKFGVEAKIGGSAGFNVAVNINNPSISGSRTMTLLSKDSSYSNSLYLGSGFNLKYKFGGLTAAVSGSGSATGTASFGAGASATAVIGAEYDTKNGFTFIKEGSFSYTPAYFITTGFTLNQLDLDVALTGIENFELTYSGYVGVTFSGALTGKMNFATTGTTALTVTLSNSLTQRRRLGADPVPIYFPGEAVRTLLTYTDFPLSETVVVFCSVLVSGGRDRSVKMVSFNTSGTGSGELAIDWVVPWDKEFANKELIFQVRTSNKMASPVETEPFTTSMFTETDGVFTAPAMNEIVPFDVPYTVSWNASLLSFFKIHTGTLFHGRERESSAVKLEVARDLLATNGTLIKTLSYSLVELENTGSATVTFASTANFTKPVASPADSVSRYYLVIRAREYNNIQSWSSGYFSFSSLSAARVLHTDHESVFRKPTLQDREREEGIVGTPQRPLKAEKTARRGLASCSGSNFGSNSGDLVTSTHAGGGITGVTTIIGNYPTPVPSTPMEIGTPTISCMAVASLPIPTLSPIASPTAAPIASPTAAPIAAPTAAPIASPTQAPVVFPATPVPTAPTFDPTPGPSASPTPEPSASPTPEPTPGPTAPTPEPTPMPSALPTPAPSPVSVFTAVSFKLSLSLSQVTVSVKAGIKTSVASAMNVPESSVASLTITAASVATADSLRRKLTQGDPSRRLQSAINVAAILVTASTPASFSTTTFSNSLQASTQITATLSNLAVVDQTPTATPTAMPTKAPVDNSSGSSSSNTPIIIGAVVGGVLLVALVAGGFAYQRKAKPINKAPATEKTTTNKAPATEKTTINKAPATEKTSTNKAPATEKISKSDESDVDEVNSSGLVGGPSPSFAANAAAFPLQIVNIPVEFFSTLVCGTPQQQPSHTKRDWTEAATQEDLEHGAALPPPAPKPAPGAPKAKDQKKPKSKQKS